jgi:hypothetical protein
MIIRVGKCCLVSHCWVHKYRPLLLDHPEELCKEEVIGGRLCSWAIT